MVTPLVQDRGGLQFQSSFYKVFTTDSVVDTTPPSVTVLPGASAAGVALNASAYILLDGPVDPASVTPANLSLTEGGQSVPIDLTMTGDRLSIRLRPLTPLLANKVYTVSVTGLTDISGNQMTSPVQSSFTTGADADLAFPTLVSSQPASGATSQPTNASIQLTFSEPVVGLDNGFSTISPAIPFSVQYGGGGSVVTLTPLTPFDANALVRVYFSVSDLAGNRLHGQPLLDFFTGP
jgi:hypothetical protein